VGHIGFSDAWSDLVYGAWIANTEGKEIEVSPTSATCAPTLRHGTGAQVIGAVLGSGVILLLKNELQDLLSQVTISPAQIEQIVFRCS